jgi:preprotein translocase subunit YajC
MEMVQITQLISNLGFPIFVSIFMLTTNQKSQKENTEALNELKNLVQEFINSCKRGGE